MDHGRSVGVRHAAPRGRGLKARNVERGTFRRAMVGNTGNPPANEARTAAVARLKRDARKDAAAQAGVHPTRTIRPPPTRPNIGYALSPPDDTASASWESPAAPRVFASRGRRAPRCATRINPSTAYGNGSQGGHTTTGGREPESRRHRGHKLGHHERSCTAQSGRACQHRFPRRVPRCPTQNKQAIRCPSRTGTGSAAASHGGNRIWRTRGPKGQPIASRQAGSAAPVLRPVASAPQEKA
jgi:hypothetical protein